MPSLKELRNMQSTDLEELLSRIADCVEKTDDDWEFAIALDEIARLLNSRHWKWTRKENKEWLNYSQRDY